MKISKGSLTSIIKQILNEEKIEHLNDKEEDFSETSEEPEGTSLEEASKCGKTLKITKENLYKIIREESIKLIQEEQLEQFVGLPDRQDEEDYGETTPLKEEEEKEQEKEEDTPEQAITDKSKERKESKPWQKAWEQFKNSK